MHQATLLACRHQRDREIVGALDQCCALLAIFERVLERLGDEVVYPAQQWRVDAARKARFLFIDQAERDEVRALELESEILLGGFGTIVETRTIHPDDFERLVAQIVRLLGVERENLK